MKLWVLIHTIHPTNDIYVRINMQYIPRIMKTNMRLHHCIRYTKMQCGRFGLSTFWSVDVLACRRFGLSTFWFAKVLVCWRFSLSTFLFVDVSVCRHFSLSTFWSVFVLVCRWFGLSTIWFVDVLAVDVSVCRLLTSYLSNSLSYYVSMEAAAFLSSCQVWHPYPSVQ